MARPRAEAPALVSDLCVVLILLLVILVAVATRKSRPLLTLICKQPEPAVRVLGRPRKASG